MSQQTYTDDAAEKLLADLQKFMARKGYAQPKMARVLNISASSFNCLLRREYSGDREKQLHIIEGFLDRELERASKPRLNKFVELSPSMKILKCLRNNHVNGTMGAIVAPTGVGKTTSILEYGERNPGMILVSGATWCRSHVQLSRLLADFVLSRDFPRRTQERCEAIVEELQGQARLIVVDQAHQLREDAHEFLQNLYDHCNQGIDEQRLGIVLATTWKFYNDMCSENKQYMYEQLSSRIGAGMTVSFSPGSIFSLDDMEKLFNSENLRYQLEPAAMNYLLRVANGRHGLRGAVSVADKAQDVLMRKKAAPQTRICCDDLERTGAMMLRAA